MSHKNKITVFTLLFLAINGLIIAFLIVPAFGEIKIGSEEYLAHRQELANIRAEISNFEDFEKNYHLYLDELEGMQELISGQIFVDKELPLNLIRFLNKAAADNNLLLKITPVSPSQREERASDIIVFRLNLDGQFPDFLRFFEKFENSQWLIETEDVLIAKQAREEIIKVNLLIEVHAKTKD